MANQFIIEFSREDIINHLKVLRADDILSVLDNELDEELITTLDKINEEIDLIINRLERYHRFDSHDNFMFIIGMHISVNNIIKTYENINSNNVDISIILPDKLCTFTETVIGKVIEYRNYDCNNIEDYYNRRQFHSISIDNITC